MAHAPGALADLPNGDVVRSKDLRETLAVAALEEDALRGVSCQQVVGHGKRNCPAAAIALTGKLTRLALGIVLAHLGTGNQQLSREGRVG